MPKTIRARIAILLTVLMLAVLLLSGSFLYFSLRAQLLQSLDDGLRFNAEQLLTTVENENGHVAFARGDAASSSYRSTDDLLRLVLLDGTITDHQGVSTVDIPTTIQQGRSAVFTTVTETHSENNQNTSNFLLLGDSLQHRLRIVSVPVIVDGRQLAWVQVGRSMEALYETLNELLLLLLLIMPVVVMIAAISGYWLAGRVLQPIEIIRRQAATISAQDLQKRLNLALPDDEVGRLAHTFDQMLDRLQVSFQAQQRFVSDASHELRTPLAIMRGECDVTLESPRRPAEYIETIETIGEEIGRMERLVANLLWLVRNDSTELPLQYEALDLADLLDILLELLQPQAAAANVEIKVDFPSILPLYGDTDRLIQMFTNLLENTFVYAPNSKLSISARTQDDWVIIAFTDTGPGIAPEHLPHLFERFYRVDASRNRASGGSGLGLAILQEIVQAHGGTVAVTTVLGDSTQFLVKLPLSPLTSQKSRVGSGRSS